MTGDVPAAEIKAHGVLTVEGDAATLTLTKEEKDAQSSGTSTLTSQIIMEMGQTPPGSPWSRALFMMAFGLLLVSLLMILLVRWIGNRGVAR